MLVRYFIYGYLFLNAIGCVASDTTAPPGFLEGHLTIRSPNPVDVGDGNAPTVTPENYDEYTLLILSRAKKKEIARVTADKNGNYRAELPPGDYVLEVQGRSRTHLRWKPQPFTILSNRTVQADMDVIDTDEWRARSTL